MKTSFRLKKSSSNLLPYFHSSSSPNTFSVSSENLSPSHTYFFIGSSNNELTDHTRDIKELITHFKPPFPPSIQVSELVYSKPKDGKFPTKPPNVFMIYRRIFTQAAKKVGYKLPMRMVSTMASQAWESESTWIKREYKRIARLVKLEYERTYPKLRSKGKINISNSLCDKISNSSDDHTNLSEIQWNQYPTIDPEISFHSASTVSNQEMICDTDMLNQSNCPLHKNNPSIQSFSSSYVPQNSLNNEETNSLRFNHETPSNFQELYKPTNNFNYPFHYSQGSQQFALFSDWDEIQYKMPGFNQHSFEEIDNPIILTNNHMLPSIFPKEG
ncbi:hypothetical protein G9A89_007715 [Geosiphon pyriformis]|nr:hypothetical protein G9A89_007715 [Geosiphon pyriformis]